MLMTSSRYKKSALTHILLGLIPYSRDNLALSFAPSKFFRQLEASTGYSERAFKQAYYRARQRGYITTDTVPRLTQKGLRVTQPFVAHKLKSDAQLMIIFDIPEANAFLRRQLRLLLRQLEFQQVQKSVWATDYDYKDLLIEAVGELRLDGCVEIFECARIYPNSTQKVSDRTKSGD